MRKFKIPEPSIMRILLLLLIIMGSFFHTDAQTKYGFAYAYNSSNKTIYVSHAINLEKYSNCKDDYGYDSNVTIEACLNKEFSKSLKIEVGSNYTNYKIVITTQHKVDTYSSDYFKSEEAAAAGIKNVMADFREQNFTLQRLDP